MIKKLLSLAMVLIMAIGVLSACGTKEAETPSSTPEIDGETSEEPSGEEPDTVDFTSGMITDVGGINDESYNQSAWNGMKEAEAELGIAISYLESQKEADYPANLEKMTDEKHNIIWGIGFLMKQAMGEAAESNPDQLYALVDDAFDDGELANVISVIFKAEESSFLVGYIASYMTTTNKVGFIVGMESPTMDRFKYGYKAGVLYGAKEQGKEIEVFDTNLESFSDTAKGKAAAQKMYTDGADIIFHAAGQSGLGAIEAAKEMDKMAIGVDLDQNYLAPDHVITSSLKNVNVAIREITKKVYEGGADSLGGTTVEMGLKEGGVGIAPSSETHVPADVLEKTKAIEQKVIDGEIVVPATVDGMTEFEGTL